MVKYDDIFDKLPEYIFENYYLDGYFDDILRNHGISSLPKEGNRLYYTTILFILYILGKTNKMFELKSIAFQTNYLNQLEEEAFDLKFNIDNTLYNIYIDRCSLIRDIVYSEEKDALNKCHILKDYQQYLLDYPNNCREFILYARYRISEIKHQRFKELNEVLDRFNDSDIFNLLELGEKYKSINGLNVIWSDTVNSSPIIKKQLEEIINSLILITCSGSKTLKNDYYISKMLITKEQWCTIMNSSNNRTYILNDFTKTCPVTVSYTEVKSFINIINDITFLDFKIPTIEEWEFAAKEGLDEQYMLYSGSNNIDEVAWHKEERMQKCCEKKPNSLGIYDMSGNSWEWCLSDNEDKIPIKGGSFFSPNKSWCQIQETQYVTKNSYAGIRLVILKNENNRRNN